jgi:hypothetical protein
MVNDHENEVFDRVGDSPVGGATQTETSGRLSSPQLTVLGVLGGVYLFYTIGWASTSGRRALILFVALCVSAAMLINICFTIRFGSIIV